MFKGTLGILLILLLLIQPVSAYYKNGLATLPPLDEFEMEEYGQYVAEGRKSESYWDKKTQFEASAKYHSPIIFIHGVMGSYLVNQKGQELWPGAIGRRRHDLILKEDGRTPQFSNSKITATAPITHYITPTAYYGYFQWMNKQMPYGYRGKSGKYGWVGRSHFSFSYDFRLDNRDQIKLLEKYVNQIRTRTKSDKVILVAHSMGGYVARLYAKKNPKKVKAIIFLSSPHHGAPKAFEAVTNGYNFGVPQVLATDYEVWSISRNWPGPHQLIPDHPFMYDEGNLLSVKDTLYGDWISVQMTDHIRRLTDLSQNVLTEQQAQDIIKKELKTGIYSKKMADMALKFNKLYDDITLDKNIKLYIINGKGKPTSDHHLTKYTLESVSYKVGEEFNSDTRTMWPTFKETRLPVKTLTLDPQIRDTGDETVSFKGLQWNKVSKDKTWEIVGSHGDVPSLPAAHRLMEPIIEELNHDRRDLRLTSKIAVITNRNLLKIKDTDSNEASARVYAERVDDATYTGPGSGLPGSNLVDKNLLDKWRDDLVGRTIRLIFGEFGEGKTTKLNIVIPDAGNYDSKNKDFKAFVIIRDNHVYDFGIGEAVAPTATIQVRNTQVLDDLIDGNLKIGHAYDNGDIKLKKDIVKGLIAKAIRRAQLFISEAR